MRRGLIGLVAGVALMASVGIATAKEPLKLTDGQMDGVTAGGTNPTVSSTQPLNNLVTISNNHSVFSTHLPRLQPRHPQYRRG
jgi:hypothetical protein